MFSSLAIKHYFLFFGCLFMALLPFSAAESKTHFKQINSKYTLVPPPPPYVPSMLPELTQYRGYGHNYSSFGQSRAGSTQTFKPNKYITYCLTNKT